MNDNEIRLQKYLANCGIASRRKCEELILEGEISVNGEVVTGDSPEELVDHVYEYLEENPMF